MAYFAQIPTLVATAVLGPDWASMPDLARFAFGALLWIVLVVLNRSAAGASPRPSALEVGALPSLRRRLEPTMQVRDGRRVATSTGRAAPVTPRAGFRAAR